MDSMSSEGKRKNYPPDNNRSPWSSESTNSSTSPLPMASALGAGLNTSNTVLINPNRFHFEHSFGSGGSTCSLGSSPGASFSSSLIVPDNISGCQKLVPTHSTQACPSGSSLSKAANRSTSPFNLKARVRRRREKRLEKQAKLNATSCEDHLNIEASLHASNFGGSCNIRQIEKLCLRCYQHLLKRIYEWSTILDAFFYLI